MLQNMDERYKQLEERPQEGMQEHRRDMRRIDLQFCVGLFASVGTPEKYKPERYELEDEPDELVA